MHIRTATSADVPALAVLFRQEVECQRQFGGFQLAPDIDWERQVRDRIARSHSVWFVAQNERGLLGFIALRVVHRGGGSRAAGLRSRLRRLLQRDGHETGPIVEPKPCGYIEDAFVLAEHRNRGIASGLVDCGLKWLAERGVHEAEAAIWVGNKASKALFREMQFKEARMLMRRNVA